MGKCLRVGVSYFPIVWGLHRLKVSPHERRNHFQHYNSREDPLVGLWNILMSNWQVQFVIQIKHSLYLFLYLLITTYRRRRVHRTLGNARNKEDVVILKSVELSQESLAGSEPHRLVSHMLRVRRGCVVEAFLYQAARIRHHYRTLWTVSDVRAGAFVAITVAVNLHTWARPGVNRAQGLRLSRWWPAYNNAPRKLRFNDE